MYVALNLQALHFAQPPTLESYFGCPGTGGGPAVVFDPLGEPAFYQAIVVVGADTDDYRA